MVTGGEATEYRLEQQTSQPLDTKENYISTYAQPRTAILRRQVTTDFTMKKDDNTMHGKYLLLSGGTELAKDSINMQCDEN